MSTLIVTVPLVGPGITAQEAFDRMTDAGVSGVVYQEHGTYYLIEAGALFVAMRQKSPWNPRESGVPIANSGTFRVDRALSNDRISLSALRPAWAARLNAGPAACYCLTCESAAQSAGKCKVCGGTVDCK